MKPILFSAPMVAAILDGRKTVTRRVIEPQPIDCKNGWYEYINGKSKVTWNAKAARESIGTAPIENHCRYQVGDLLWVRESYKFGQAPNDEPDQGVALYVDGRCKFHPDLDQTRRYWCRQWKPRPSIHMWQWASRITLKVTGVGAERVQDITEDDAVAEGLVPWESEMVPGIVHYGISIADVWETDPRLTFGRLWDAINTKRGYPWASNAWVWVVRFEVAEVSHAS